MFLFLLTQRCSREKWRESSKNKQSINYLKSSIIPINHLTHKIGDIMCARADLVWLTIASKKKKTLANPWRMLEGPRRYAAHTWNTKKTECERHSMSHWKTISSRWGVNSTSTFFSSPIVNWQYALRPNSYQMNNEQSEIIETYQKSFETIIDCPNLVDWWVEASTLNNVNSHGHMLLWEKKI